MAQQTTQSVKRYPAAQRFEHLVVIVSVLGLALTGLSQKFAGNGWANKTIELLGGVESTRILHRFLAALLLITAVYHLAAIVYGLYVLGRRATMKPGRRDLSDLRDWLLYSFGAKAEPPQLPRYTFWQKAHYYLVGGSVLVLAFTGFMMWDPIAWTRILPGSTIPAARAAHGGLAILVVLVLVVWHVYGSSLRYLNLSMLTGRLSRKAMQQDHAEELAAIDRGERPGGNPPEEVARRKRRFWPVVVVIGIVLAVLAVLGASEKSALTTVPRQQVLIYAPQTMPEAGDPAIGEVLWPTLRCRYCHGPEAGGIANVGPSLRGTILTFDEFFQQVRTGSLDATGYNAQMPPFDAGEIPDGYLLHLWTWLAGLSTP